METRENASLKDDAINNEHSRWENTENSNVTPQM
jgi:hypothetical protein